jgi:hypothetical protein
MINEEEMANIVQLFARLGDTLATDLLFEDAKEAVGEGRRDIATHLLDLSERFFRLRIEAKDNGVGKEADGMRVIGISLRLAAHKLHKECGKAADDPRLLRLVYSSTEIS